MSFSGLCIGGPMDGVFIESYTQSFEAMEAPPLDMSAVINPDETCPIPKTTRYVHDFVGNYSLGNSRAILNIFRPEGQSLLDTIAKLIVGYQASSSRR